MSGKPSYIIHKLIFQVKFKPNISFFNQLSNLGHTAKYFTDWEGDRLGIRFKDYKKHQSLEYRPDSILFSTDAYHKEEFEKVLDLIKRDLVQYYNDFEFERFGYRVHLLFPVDMSSEELVKVLNLKFYNPDLVECLNEIVDNSVTVVVRNLNERIKCRLLLGPMRKEEIGKFIQLDLKNHFYNSDKSNLLDINSAFDKIPANGFYVDADFLSDNSYKVEDYLKEVDELLTTTLEKLNNYIFKQRV